VSLERVDLGRALKSIGDSYIERNPADAASVRAGVDRYARRRTRFVLAGAGLAAGAAALVVFFATSSGAPEDTFQPADEPKLDIVQEVPLDGSPLQVAAKEDVAWVTRYEDSTVSRIEIGASSPTWERDIGAVPTDIVATGDGLWITDRATNSVVRFDPETGERLRAWELEGPPGRLAVGGEAIRVTVDGLGVVRIDRATGEQKQIYSRPAIDIAMGENAFWVFDANGRLVPIDPDTGKGVLSLEAPQVVGEGEVTFLRDALYYGVEGNPTLWRFDESTGLETDRIQLPGAYQDIDADAEGLWALVRDGRLGELVELDPTTGAVGDTSLQLEDDPVDIVTGDDGVWVALASGGRVILVR
jgi:streptogramin lyase